MHVCVWTPGWSTGEEPAAEVLAALLRAAPRIAVERRGVVWADARGLDPAAVALRLLDHLGDAGPAAAGAASTPVAAEAAARLAAEPAPAGNALPAVSALPTASAAPPRRLCLVPPGADRDFLAPLPLRLLAPGEALRLLLEGVGIRTCGELAALPREAVEVRFGTDGVALWHLARADDGRRIFAPLPRELPHASLDFLDYVVSDPERLIFTANALLSSVCDALRGRGEHARRLELVLALDGGGEWRQTLRAARPTASREAWLRLVRAFLERTHLPDAVAGVAFRVQATESAAAVQGDLFDRGFATAGVVEAALERILERGDIIVDPECTPHPLPERRTRWLPRPANAHVNVNVPVNVNVNANANVNVPVPVPHLSLQLLPAPLPVAVELAPRRDHAVPTAFGTGDHWHRVVTALGPDRVSGGRWEPEPYAREYFRVLTDAGLLAWLYHDVRRDAWFLHGWWD